MGYINVIFPSGMPANFVPSFEDAADFWNAVLVSGAPPADLSGFNAGNSQCDVDFIFPEGSIVQGIDIFASLPFIDGPGRILGRAGPCKYHGSIFQTPLFPQLGIMEFDSADAEGLGEQFKPVVIHEMGHVIGIGTLWPVVELLDNPCPLFIPRPCDPSYNGREGIAGYNTLQLPASAPQKPLVENTGGQGTANGHWREVTFDNELMTGFLNAGQDNPLSVLTIMSLRDLGYTVNLGVAEEYVPPQDVDRNIDFGRVVQLFGDIMEFKDEPITQAEEEATFGGEYDSEFAGMFILMVTGFAALAGLMAYMSAKQKKMYEQLPQQLGLSVKSPMHKQEL